MSGTFQRDYRDRIIEFVRVPAADLKPSPANWRTHPEAQRGALRAMLDKVGIVDAALARRLPDGTLELVDGHLRAEEIGGLIPTLVLDVDEAEAGQVLATLDPLSAMAGTDGGKLDALLAGFRGGPAVAGLDGLIEELGRKATLAMPEPERHADPDDVPPVEPVIHAQPGDLILLGKHRLLCGDSTNAEDVARLMDGADAGLLFTSPPYAQQREYGEASSLDDWDWLMDGVFAAAQLSASTQVLVNLGLIHKNGRVDRYWDGWLGRMEANSWRLFGWYVWDKISATFKANDGRPYVAHEWVFHFNRESVPAIEWQECKHAGEDRSVWGQRKPDGHVERLSTPGKIKSHRPPDTIARVQRETANADASVRSHPARFPVGFADYWLKTWPGDVYEPFCGSGTTLIAAESLGRRCFAMEIEPRYVDVIVRRWQTYTGKTAEGWRGNGR